MNGYMTTDGTWLVANHTQITIVGKVDAIGPQYRFSEHTFLGPLAGAGAGAAAFGYFQEKKDIEITGHILAYPEMIASASDKSAFLWRDDGTAMQSISFAAEGSTRAQVASNAQVTAALVTSEGGRNDSDNLSVLAGATSYEMRDGQALVAVGPLGQHVRELARSYSSRAVRVLNNGLIIVSGHDGGTFVDRSGTRQIAPGRVTLAYAPDLTLVLAAAGDFLAETEGGDIQVIGDYAGGEITFNRGTPSETTLVSTFAPTGTYWAQYDPSDGSLRSARVLMSSNRRAAVLPLQDDMAEGFMLTQVCAAATWGKDQVLADDDSATCVGRFAPDGSLMWARAVPGRVEQGIAAGRDSFLITAGSVLGISAEGKVVVDEFMGVDAKASLLVGGGTAWLVVGGEPSTVVFPGRDWGTTLDRATATHVLWRLRNIPSPTLLESSVPEGTATEFRWELGAQAIAGSNGARLTEPGAQE